MMTRQDCGFSKISNSHSNTYNFYSEHEAVTEGLVINVKGNRVCERLKEVIFRSVVRKVTSSGDSYICYI